MSGLSLKARRLTNVGVVQLERGSRLSRQQRQQVRIDGIRDARAERQANCTKRPGEAGGRRARKSWGGGEEEALTRSIPVAQSQTPLHGWCEQVEQKVAPHQPVEQVPHEHYEHC